MFRGHRLRDAVRCAVVLGIALYGAAEALPAALAQEEPAAGCAAALVSEGTTFEELPMEPWTWAGDWQDLGRFDSRPVVLCQASGPRERLPLQNAIGCLLVDRQVARVADRLLCGAYLSIERPGDTLLWVAHNSAATAQVTPLRWQGDRFSMDAPFVACADFPLRPVRNPDQPDCAGPASPR
jgi:hypothetical protein